MRMEEAVNRFLMYLGSLDRSDATIYAYKKELGYFQNFLCKRYGHEPEIEEVTLEDMEAYMFEIKEKGKSSATRNRVVYILRSFYNYAFTRKLCKENLPLHLEPVRKEVKERVFLNEKEVELLFDHIDHPLVKVAVQTLYYTGMRVSELTNLELKDVDLAEGVIYVINGKGKKNRKIPINQKLSVILHHYLEEIRIETTSPLFFCTKKTGKLSPGYINYTLHKAQEESHISKNISAHILRHSFASNLVKKNVPLSYIQELLGHADLRVTSVYIHQEFNQLQDAVDQI